MSEVERTLREAELPSFEPGQSSLEQEICCLKGERSRFGLGLFSSELGRSSLKHEICYS